MNSKQITEPLEIPCGRCNGDGVVSTYHGERQCPKCFGSGFAPTELGERILDLMRHHFRPMLEDAQG